MATTLHDVAPVQQNVATKNCVCRQTPCDVATLLNGVATSFSDASQSQNGVATTKNDAAQTNAVAATSKCVAAQLHYNLATSPYDAATSLVDDAAQMLRPLSPGLVAAQSGFCAANQNHKRVSLLKS